MNLVCCVIVLLYDITLVSTSHLGTNWSASNGLLFHVQQRQLKSKHGLELATSVGALGFGVSPKELASDPNGRNSPLAS